MIILHVPCAMVAVLAYVVSMAYAIGYLATRRLVYDICSAVSAGLGLSYTILATATGMIFAYVEWNSVWNWDPRETSILILMIVYAAYFALRTAIPTSARARISAVYAIMAGIVMPFFVFAMPRMVPGLHPDNTLTDRAGLATEYRIVLIASAIGLVWVFIWLFRYHVRVRMREI